MKFWGISTLPLKLPLILMTPTNDWPALTMEFNVFMTSATAAALPLVALPAFELWSTAALPVLAARTRLLLIVPLSLAFTVRLFTLLLNASRPLAGCSWFG